jgi:hypothetical protein
VDDELQADDLAMGGVSATQPVELPCTIIFIMRHKVNPCAL